jgi:antitoxin MazE
MWVSRLEGHDMHLFTFWLQLRKMVIIILLVVSEMERKITKIGNSLGITLPAEILQHLGVTQGDELVFALEEGKASFKKRPIVAMDGFEEIDERFLTGMQDLFANYDQALRKLAKR